MILRRFMKHVSDQNWFAVGLDAIVVITGIFVGMQVSEWNEGRKDSALEQVYLERLLQDFTKNVATLDRLAGFQAGIRKDVNKVASFLALDKWNESEHDKVKKQRMLWAALPFADLQTGAWDELVASGRLVLIENDGLRSQLQQAAASNIAAEGQMSHIRNEIEIATRDFNDYMTLRRADDGELFLTPNFKPVFGNEDVVKNLLVTASLQGRAFSIRSGQATLNREVLQHLNCLLKATICEAEGKSTTE